VLEACTGSGLTELQSDWMSIYDAGLGWVRCMSQHGVGNNDSGNGVKVKCKVNHAPQESTGGGVLISLFPALSP